VVKACDERALVLLERESQLAPGDIEVIRVECAGLGQPKCASCEKTASPQPRYAALDALKRMSPDERRQLRRDVRDAGREIYPSRR